MFQHFLGYLHLDKPERAKDYFNQSLLEDPTRSQDESVTPVT